MFLEPYSKHPKTGWIEVISGCMFSGKSEELMRRLKRAQIADQKIITFKPASDDRYGSDIISHNQNSYECRLVVSSAEIYAQAEKYEVIGIDEVQFLDEGIIGVVNRLANAGKRVIVAGLDMDYKGKPFGPMPFLMAIAEFVTKLHAVCHITGEIASFSYKVKGSEDQVEVGGSDVYQARSRRAFNEGMKSKSDH